MSQYFFAVLQGEFGQKLRGGIQAARKRNRIAKKINPNAGYIYYYREGEHRWYGHGYCRDLGDPFNGRTARAVEDAWRQAGV